MLGLSYVLIYLTVINLMRFITPNFFAAHGIWSIQYVHEDSSFGRVCFVVAPVLLHHPLYQVVYSRHVIAILAMDLVNTTEILSSEFQIL